MRYERLSKALEHLVGQHGPVDGRTRLVKLLYLADRAWHARTGRVYTECTYFRWNHGPFAREITSALEWLDGVEVIQERATTPSGAGYRYRAGTYSRLENVKLDPAFVEALDEVARKWKDAPLQDLLDHVYSKPDLREANFGDPLLPPV